MYLAGVAVECKLGVYGPVDVSLLFAVTDIHVGKLSTTRGPSYETNEKVRTKWLEARLE